MSKEENNLPEILNSIKDVNNPRSILNITQGSLSKAISLIPNDVLELPEDKLRKLGNCNELDEKLRFAFWTEYERAQATNTKMILGNIWKGNCSDVHFYNAIIPNKIRLAYIVTPPTDYLTHLNVVHELGFRRMLQILNYDPVDKNGIVNPKLADVQRKIWEAVDLRIKGAIPYKLMSENLHVHKTVTESSKGSNPESLEELRDRVKLLEAEKSQEGQSEVRDVQESQGES